MNNASEQKPKRFDRIIIRPWPKVIFFYPTLLVALVAWVAAFILDSQKAGQPGSPMLGGIFMIVFLTNLLVFSFDFSRIKSITIVFIAIAIMFALMWANNKYEVMTPIRDFINSIDIRMSRDFYFFVVLFFALIYLLVFVNSRFNYYEINRNEILHHSGYLGDIQRTPTSAMRMQKEIYDLMEYLLLRSGRIIFYPATTREAVVIDNVINVNVVENRIKELLSSVSVAIDIDPTSAGPIDNAGQI
ncbi:MAG: hypothetical protein CSA62_11130 [Planctomycetota bacterium]|nr:MAG: hypothetical protein CSA62_11130 [Planctomycetota bacterium]